MKRVCFNQNTGLNVWPVAMTSKYYTLELLPCHHTIVLPVILYVLRRFICR